MGQWRDHAGAEARLAAIADLANVAATIVIEVGSTDPELPEMLVQRTGLRVLTAHSVPGADHSLIERSDAAQARPGQAARDALASLVAVVVLSNPTPNEVYLWAAALDTPGSVVAALDPKGVVPPLGRVSCRGKLQSGLFVAIRQATTLAAPRAVGWHPPPTRPLRSVYLGDLRYPSLYAQGVMQGMTLAGGWHREVPIRAPVEVIDRAVREMRPDVIWTHMLLWPPDGAPPVYDLLDLAASWRRQGAFVLVHDGDPRAGSRYPHDIRDAVDLVLCNHTVDRSAWGVPQVHWPYGVLAQDRIAVPSPEYACDLAFAGLMREGDLYGPRTATVKALQEKLGEAMRVYDPQAAGYSNRFLIADIAPSCAAMIGFGRPEMPGWIDTRVLTVPGAGGVLIHDDPGGLLEPGHYLPCVRYDVDSVLEALARARTAEGEAIRQAGFTHVQRCHTYRQRVWLVLDMLFHGGSGE